MQRDMDIVRRIALKTLDLPYGKHLDCLEGVDKATFAMHVIWMEEAGLIKAIISRSLGPSPPHAKVERLTWEGCEFADAVRNDTIWNKAKESVLKPASSFTFSVLKEWISAEIRDGFPTLR